eukprot:scaffold186_cov189-Skeletonema_marinoi.AAC.1
MYSNGKQVCPAGFGRGLGPTDKRQLVLALCFVVALLAWKWRDLPEKGGLNKGIISKRTCTSPHAPPAQSTLA